MQDNKNLIKQDKTNKKKKTKLKERCGGDAKGGWWGRGWMGPMIKLPWIKAWNFQWIKKQIKKIRHETGRQTYCDSGIEAG